MKNDNNYLTCNLLISKGCGGGEGKNSAKGRAKEKAKLLFKKRQAAKKVSEGLPLTEEGKRFLILMKLQIKKIKGKKKGDILLSLEQLSIKNRIKLLDLNLQKYF